MGENTATMHNITLTYLGDDRGLTTIVPHAALDDLLQAIARLEKERDELHAQVQQLQRERAMDIQLLDQEVQEVVRLRTALVRIAGDFQHDRHSVLADGVLDGDKSVIGQSL